MKLGTKLLAVFLAVGLIPFCINGMVTLKKSGDALSEQTFSKLQAVREIKKSRIEKYFQNRLNLMDDVKKICASHQGFRCSVLCLPKGWKAKAIRQFTETVYPD